MSLLDATLATGEEMLQAARTEDWERVRTLRPIRDRQLQAVFKRWPTGRELTALLEPVKRLARQNHELLRLAVRERDAHGERLGVLRCAERARTAYGAHRG